MKSYDKISILSLSGFLSVSLLLPLFGYAQDHLKEKWRSFLQQTPYIYSLPAVEKPTPIDGTYAKEAKKKGYIIPCRRCPEWIPNPGIWRLRLSRGVYWIINTNTGWRSIGTYVVSGDRVIFANDPCCIYSVGVYSWSFNEGKLELKMIDDPCAIKQRGKNLSEVTWIAQ